MTSNGNTANTSGKQWTDSENYLLLYQMVQQLISKHKNNPVKFEEITLPGRSTRALKEHWAKIATGVTTAGISSQTSPGVPQVRAPRTPRGNKVKGKQAGEGATSAMKRKPTPKKNTRKKKRKAEQYYDESEGEMSNVRSETDLDTASKEDTDIDDQ